MPTVTKRRRSPSVIHPERIPAANAALDCFAAGTTLEIDRGRVFVCWERRGTFPRKQWMTRWTDFYPVWYRQWGHGLSASTALAQLVRWIQGRPVLPLSTWRYWASDGARLAGEHGPEMVAALEQSGYPESAPCVLCGRDLGNTQLDWWRLDGVSGPCCSYNDETGCRQKRGDQ
jgi:hypothetical protein